MFQKDMKISLLLDFYGDILSERRRSIIGMYYEEDLSLSEIAEETGISRQGVRDSIMKSVKELEELEEKLHLAERFGRVRNQTDSIASMIDKAVASEDISSALPFLKEASEKLRQIDL